MKSSFSRQKHNPLELIKQYWPDADVSHIEFDPSLRRGKYSIIRGSGGDGTLSFTTQMLQESLIPLLNMQSYYRPELPDDCNDIKAIKYRVGWMRHVTIFGMVYLKCSKDHKYPGQRERIRLPVISELVYR